MKKLLTLMIGIIMRMALAPAIAHADDPLQNVSISESGVVSWDPFPHAKVYSVSVIQKHGNDYHAWGGSFTKTMVDIPGELIGYHPDWVVDGATKYQVYGSKCSAKSVKLVKSTAFSIFFSANHPPFCRSRKAGFFCSRISNKFDRNC